jgi:acetoin utilization deacetylase AcuC-like enzyme
MINVPSGLTLSPDRILRCGFQRFHPDLMCYIAGADPYREDQLGGLALTIEGLKRRDDLVFNTAKAHGIPVMVTLGGGYAFNVLDTVTIHCNTVVAAKHVFSSVGLKFSARYARERAAV